VDLPDALNELPHQPVLYHAVLAYLKPSNLGHYVDATLGAGGHAYGILSASSPQGMLLGLDVDEQALQIARLTLRDFTNRILIHKASYVDLGQVMKKIGWENFNGILFDLGVSSMQLDTPERGFSFMRNGQLDMRFDEMLETKAEHIVNTYTQEQISEILFTYGEERFARRIAKAIIAERPIRSTKQLADLIAKHSRHRKGRIHPATKTFQALRIAVYQELQNIPKGLEQACRYLKTGGRLVVIAYHSLEDRLVKQFFKNESQDCICPPEQVECRCGHSAQLQVLTKRPIEADDDEIQHNPRARSAKLRAAERIA